MRKLIFIGFIGLGALIGCSPLNSDWGTRLVMMGVGALFGRPLAGHWPASERSEWRSLRGVRSRLPSDGTSSKDWRQTTGATKGIHRL
jgi:hypothetical protein